jgi:hypothetical protein
MTFVRSEPFTVIEDFLQKRVDFLIIFMYDKAITVMITVLKQKNNCQVLLNYTSYAVTIRDCENRYTEILSTQLLHF